MAETKKHFQVDTKWWLAVAVVSLLAAGAGFALGLWMGS
jgi:hypothetical protein